MPTACDLPPTSNTALPGVILDTNVVLDWMLFGNRECSPLIAAIERGALQWWASPSLQAEFDDVLGREALSPWRPDAARIAAQWRRWVHLLPDADPRWAQARFRCTDADDQKFIDLAIEHRARWLVSRDRAVLKLARRAAPLGLGIVTPARWHALNPATQVQSGAYERP